MLNKLATVLANRMLKNKIISEDRFDVYVYGLELLISFVVSTLLIICVGIFVGKILETIAFLIIFIILRSFTGGYHAKTYLMCTIVTLEIFSSVLILSHYIRINVIAYIILLFVGMVILLVLSPIEHPNKTITKPQKKRLKITSIILFTVFIASGLYLKDINERVSSAIFFTLAADLVLMLIKKERRKS